LSSKFTVHSSQPSASNFEHGTLNLLSSYGAFSKGVHLFPFRTEKLSPLWPMVLGFVLGE
jgi:hypothetical protein